MTINEKIVLLGEHLNRESLTLTALADGSGVLLDLKGSHVLSVNPVGMCIVQAVKAGCSTEDDLAERVCAEYEVDTVRALNDVRCFIDEASQWL